MWGATMGTFDIKLDEYADKTLGIIKLNVYKSNCKLYDVQILKHIKRKKRRSNDVSKRNKTY